MVTFQKGYTDYKKKHEIERNNQFDNRSRIANWDKKNDPPRGGGYLLIRG